MCFTKRFHGRQGDLIPFCFALIRQRVRDRKDQAYVDSEAEAEALIISIVSVERWWLAQASQVLEQVCVQRYRHCEAIEASP